MLELLFSKESNAMESISNGSIISVHLVTAVVANLVSFMALMALLNGIVGYAGALLGYPQLNLELIFGYAFFPIAYLIGVTENVQETLVRNDRRFLAKFCKKMPYFIHRLLAD